MYKKLLSLSLALLLFSSLVVQLNHGTQQFYTLTIGHKNNALEELVLWKVDKEILASNPAEEISSIIILNGTEEKSLVISQLRALGIDILYEYKIIPALLVSGKVKNVIKASSFSSIKSIWKNRIMWAYNLRSPFTPVQIPREKISMLREGSPFLNDSREIIQATRLWDLGYNGSGIEVAVVDTGIDWTHPDLDDLDDNPETNDPKVIVNVSFVDFDRDGIPDEDPMDYVGHGTHVAGIIAGTGEASDGLFRGIAPGAYLWNVKVLCSMGYGYWDWIIRGVEYATFGPDGIPHSGDEADVISMSLGGIGTPNDPVSMAVSNAWDYGIVVVVAAGNMYSYYSIGSPALSPKVITVGATTKDNDIAYFSSKGPALGFRGDPDIVAPGVYITSCVPYDIFGEYYKSFSGTSMATPHVSGAVALLLQAFPDATNDLIKVALINSAKDLGYGAYEQGAGLLDVYGAYLYLKRMFGEEVITIESILSTGYEDRYYYAYYKTIENDWIIAEIGSDLSVYSLTYVPTNDWVWLNLGFYIRYIVDEEEYFYSFSSLDVILPIYEEIDNKTLEVVSGILETPDGNITIGARIVLLDQKWFNVYLWVQNDEKITIEDVRLYVTADMDIYDSMNDHVIYDEETNTIYQFDENTQRPFIGLSSNNATSGYEASSFWEAYDAVYYDEFTNTSEYEGDAGLALKWSLGNLSFREKKLIEISIAIDENLSGLMTQLESAKAFHIKDLRMPFVFPKKISYMAPVQTGRFEMNVTLKAFDIPDELNITILAYLDNNLVAQNDLSMNTTYLDVSLNFTIDEAGIRILGVKIICGNRELLEIRRRLVVIGEYDITTFPFVPNDYPLRIIYGGQTVLYNLTIISAVLLENAYLEVNTPDEIIVNTNKAEFGTFRGHEFIEINISVPLETKGNYTIQLILRNSTEIFWIHSIFLEIIGDLPVAFSVERVIVEDTSGLYGFRIADGDTIIEADESALIVYNITNIANVTANYTFILLGSTNDGEVFIFPYGSVIYELPPSHTGQSIYGPIYFEPHHKDSRFIGYVILYTQCFEELIPVTISLIETEVKSQIPGIPDLTVVDIKVEEAEGDNDTVLEKGEWGALYITLKNTGTGTAVFIYGMAFSWKPDIYIDVFRTSPYRLWPAINPGETMSARNPILFYIDAKNFDIGRITVFIYYTNTTGFWMGVSFLLKVDVYFSYNAKMEHEVAIASLEHPHTLVVGSTTKINATVFNAGIHKEQGIFLCLKVENEIVANVTIAEIEPKEAITIFFSLKINQIGKKEIKVVLYAENDTIQINNELSGVIYVGRIKNTPLNVREGDFIRYVYGYINWMEGNIEYSYDTKLEVRFDEFVDEDLVRVLIAMYWYDELMSSMVLIVNASNRIVVKAPYYEIIGEYFPYWLPSGMEQFDLVPFGPTIFPVIGESPAITARGAFSAWLLEGPIYYVSPIVGVNYRVWADKSTGLVLMMGYEFFPYSYEPSTYMSVMLLDNTNIMDIQVYDLNLIVWKGEVPSYVKPGNVTVSLQIRNIGYDDAHNVIVSMYANGTFVTTANVGTISSNSIKETNVTFSLLQEGKYYITIVVSAEEVDFYASNNLYALQTNIDGTPPNIKILLSKNATVAKGKIEVEVVTSSPDVAKVELYVNRKLIGVLEDSPYRWTIDLWNLGPGRHTIRALAYDYAGNVGEAEIYLVLQPSIEYILMIAAIAVIPIVLFIVVIWMRIKRRRAP